MMKKSIIFLLILTLILSIGLAGCIGKETDDVDNTLEEYPESNTANILRIGGVGPNGIFNPNTYSTVPDEYIIDLIFEELLNIRPDGTVITEGSLAEDYKVSEDGLVYTFNMREGISWHDGKPVTAHDAVWTYNAIFDPDYKGSHYSSVMGDIVGAAEVKAGTATKAEGVKALDDYTLEIRMKESKGTTLPGLSTWIMPAHYYGGKDEEEMEVLNRQPLGNGPFKLKQYEVGQYVEMEANIDYWQGAPKLDGIIYRVVANADGLVEFEMGNIDAVNFQSSIENYEKIKEYEHGIVINNMNNRYDYIGLNFTNPILADKNIRQALTYGLDRQSLIDSVFGQIGGVVANTPMSPVSWAYPPEEELKDYSYNKEKAIELLEESGWMPGPDGIREKDGKRLALKWISYKESDFSTKITELAADQWKEIGVHCTIELMDLNSLLDLIANPENKEKWDMWNMAWGLDVDPNMYSIFSKNQFPPGNNRGFFHNEEIEQLMKDGLAELDQENRKVIYGELGKKFNEELPYIFICIRRDPWLVNKRLINFTPSEFLRWTHNAHEISIDQQ